MLAKKVVSTVKKQTKILSGMLSIAKLVGKVMKRSIMKSKVVM